MRDAHDEGGVPPAVEGSVLMVRKLRGWRRFLQARGAASYLAVAPLIRAWPVRNATPRAPAASQDAVNSMESPSRGFLAFPTLRERAPWTSPGGP